MSNKTPISPLRHPDDPDRPEGGHFWRELNPDVPNATYQEVVNERDALLQERDRLQDENQRYAKVLRDRVRGIEALEKSFDDLEVERDRLREALEQIAKTNHVMSPCATRFARNNDDDDPFDCDCPVSIARAALSGKEGEGNGN